MSCVCPCSFVLTCPLCGQIQQKRTVRLYLSGEKANVFIATCTEVNYHTFLPKKKEVIGGSMTFRAGGTQENFVGAMLNSSWSRFIPGNAFVVTGVYLFGWLTPPPVSTLPFLPGDLSSLLISVL